MTYRVKNIGIAVVLAAFAGLLTIFYVANYKGNERAVQMEGTANELLVGTLKTGDHVDILANWTHPESGQLHVSKVIVRNVLVLKAAEDSGNGGIGASDNKFSVQLRATDAQLQKIYWARKNGVLSLLLRPPADAANSPRSVDDSDSLFRTR